MGAEFSSHADTLSALQLQFTEMYNKDPTMFNQAIEKATINTANDPTSGTVTFNTQTNCFLVKLNDYLVAVRINDNDKPTLHDVIELENENDNVFGPVLQKTGTQNTLQITSALGTLSSITFSSSLHLQHWKNLLQAAIVQYNADNEQGEQRNRTTSTTELEHDPVSNIQQEFTSLSSNDVHWEIQENGTVGNTEDFAFKPCETKENDTSGTTKKTKDFARETSFATIEQAMKDEMLPDNVGIYHASQLIELIPHAVTKTSRKSKWVEIVDDVLIYYNWDSKQAPKHQDKLKAAPKYIDLETIEAVHLGILDNMLGIDFFKCCGGVRGSDLSHSYQEKKKKVDTEQDVSTTKKNTSKKEYGFSIVYKVGMRRVGKSFVTSNLEQAEIWVNKIEECQACNATVAGTATETFDNFMKNCNNGDVLLFRGNKTHNKLLRGITQSKFDHVGMVIRGPSGPYLFDATGDGICLHTFAKFQRKKWYKPYQYVCRRSLEWFDENHEKIAMPEKHVDLLHKFVENTVGMHYRLSPSSLLHKSKKKMSKKKKGYFCSELVAAAYQAIGILPLDKPQAQQYWPGTFQFTAKGMVKMDQRMKDTVGVEAKVVPHLDRLETRILWTGVDNVPTLTVKAKRGGCLGL